MLTTPDQLGCPTDLVVDAQFNLFVIRYYLSGSTDESHAGSIYKSMARGLKGWGCDLSSCVRPL